MDEVEYPTNSLYKMEPYEIYDFFLVRSYFEYKLNNIIFQKSRGVIPPNEPDTKRRNEYNKKCHDNVTIIIYYCISSGQII